MWDEQAKWREFHGVCQWKAAHLSQSNMYLTCGNCITITPSLTSYHISPVSPQACIDSTYFVVLWSGDRTLLTSAGTFQLWYSHSTYSLWFSHRLTFLCLPLYCLCWALEVLNNIISESECVLVQFCLVVPSLNPSSELSLRSLHRNHWMFAPYLPYGSQSFHLDYQFFNNQCRWFYLRMQDSCWP